MPQAFASGCWMQAIDGAWYGLLYRRRRERKWESERTWNGFRWRGIWIWSLPCGFLPHTTPHLTDATSPLGSWPSRPCCFACCFVVSAGKSLLFLSASYESGIPSIPYHNPSLPVPRRQQRTSTLSESNPIPTVSIQNNRLAILKISPRRRRASLHIFHQTAMLLFARPTNSPRSNKIPRLQPTACERLLRQTLLECPVHVSRVGLADRLCFFRACRREVDLQFDVARLTAGV
jgi:hypothetical protein